MKLHRYYLADRDLTHNFWMNDERLYHQWTRVLRYEIGREVVLFNDNREVRLYKIAKIGDNAVHVELVTELEPKLPERELYLCFALLKKDKNEWVLQKGTELGVSHFVPLITDRTEKTGWDSERAEKIVIEATEQCERADIPRLRDPLHVAKLIEELSGKVDLYIAEEGSEKPQNLAEKVAVLIGPEGGWSDEEKQLFKEKGIKHLALSGFTLRAETAAITAASLLQ
ncbi:16S rRNA (uracil(1498)-N(3))-methyltransferase [Candidatus Saccharibacteria bacterium]|nr:16S rRNA (uracil(1498)-N(3))-methyltransferase [Candidatus Saccharibacteria bacterium]